MDLLVHVQVHSGERLLLSLNRFTDALVKPNKVRSSLGYLRHPRRLYSESPF